MSKKENSRNKKGLIPTKKQWNSWSLPSKIGVIGTLVGIIGLTLTVIGLFTPIIMSSPNIGDKFINNSTAIQEAQLQIKASFFYDKGKKFLPYLLFTTTNMGNDDVVLSKQTLLFNSGKGQYFFSAFLQIHLMITLSD